MVPSLKGQRTDASYDDFKYDAGYSQSARIVTPYPLRAVVRVAAGYVTFDTYQ